MLRTTKHPESLEDLERLAHEGALNISIITATIAVGHVFAAIASDRAADQGGTVGLVTSFVAFAAYIIPYFIIPFAFRFAGGLIGTLGGFVNDRSRGGFDRLKKFRQGQSDKRLAHYGQVYGDKVMQGRAEAIRPTQ